MLGKLLKLSGLARRSFGANELINLFVNLTELLLVPILLIFG